MADRPSIPSEAEFLLEEAQRFSAVDAGMRATTGDIHAAIHRQLSAEEISTIQQKSQALIDDIAYADPAEVSFFTAEEVIENVYGFVDHAESELGQEVLWYFFNQLYAYCTDCQALSDSGKVQCIHNICTTFITAENVDFECPAFHALQLPHKIMFASLLSGLPQVPDSHLRFLQEDLLYELDAADATLTSMMLHQVVSKQPPEAIVDYVHFLQSLGATGIQDDIWLHQLSIETVNNQFRMLEDHPAPIVRYAVQLARLELFVADERYPDPFLASSTRVDESNKTSFERICLESLLLHNVIRTDNPSLDMLWKVRIADDAIGLMSNDGLLSHIMHIKPEDVQKVPVVDLSRHQSLLKAADDKQASIIETMAEVMELDSFAPTTDLSRYLKDEGLSFSEKNWNGLCERTKLEAHLMHEYNDLSDRLFNDITTKHETELHEAIKKIWYLIQDGGVQGALVLTHKEEVSLFRRETTYGYLLAAFESGINLLQDVVRFSPEWIPDVDQAKLHEFFTHVQQLFYLIKSECDIANDEIFSKKQEVESILSSEAPETDLVTKEIARNESGARIAVKKFLQQKIDSINRQRTVLSALPIHDLFYNEHLFPFGPEKARGMVQILQQSHRPELRRMIEQDLDIQFEELSLRSQVHLMRFLMGQNDSAFDRLRTLMYSHTNPAVILESFLACSEDTEMGNVILDLAEKEESAKMLEKYAEIASQSEQISLQLSERMQEGGRSDLSSQYFYRALIKNANDSLRKAQIALCSSSDNSVTLKESLESLRIDRKQIDTMRLLTGAISKSDVNALDVSQISDLSFHSNIPVHSLSSEMREQLRSVVRSSFDHAQDYLEFDAFLRHPDAIIHYTQCGDEVLGMIGMQNIGDVSYLDWFATNKHAAVRGWAEPTMRTVMKYIDPEVQLACVSSPLSASLEALIEHAGLVATDVTDDGEYDEPYLRMRRVASDTALSSKGLKPDEMTMYLKNAPRIEHGTKTEGEYRFARVDKNDAASNAALFSVMKDLKNDGWILTRFVPDAENRALHLCVFERDSATQEESSQIQHVFHQFKEYQASVASQSNSKDMRSMDTID